MSKFEQVRVKLMRAVSSPDLGVKESVMDEFTSEVIAQFLPDEQFVLGQLLGDVNSTYFEQEFLQNQQEAQAA